MTNKSKGQIVFINNQKKVKFMQRLKYAFLITLVFFAVTPVQAEIPDADIQRLGLAYYNRFIPYAAATGAHEYSPAVLAEVEALGYKGAVLDRYKAMAKGMALMYVNDWNEGVEVATQLDIRLSALLFEPGDQITLNILPVYVQDELLDAAYQLNAVLLDSQDRVVTKAQPFTFTRLEPSSFKLAIPMDAAAGLYTVRFQLRQDKQGGAVFYTAKRPLHIMPGIRGRLEAVSGKLEQARKAGLPSLSVRNELSNTTLEWYLEMYGISAGLSDKPDKETLPLFLYFLMSQKNMNTGRINFSAEIELVEALVGGLLDGSDPLKTRSGDIRLAYRSSVDNELVPFRMMIPESFNPANEYPLVIGLHGAGGTENYMMDGFHRLFPDNANRRGYIAVAVNGRGTYRGYKEEGQTDVIDVTNLVQRAWPVKKDNTFLTGHSMGGAGTVIVGFENPDRFAALAPIAGWYIKNYLEKAPNMPLLISAGELDSLVSVGDMRRFHQMSIDLEMPNVKYIEVEGADHMSVVNHVLNRVFDWFDQHAR
jgi:predicted esterase